MKRRPEDGTGVGPSTGAKTNRGPDGRCKGGSYGRCMCPAAVASPEPDVHEPLWRACKSGSQHARERLILAHRPLVALLAGRLGKSLPTSFDRAELVSFGTVGLIEAVERFDPDRGVPFESYAAQRIRGAILDGLRGLDWAPKSVRLNARALESSATKLTSKLKRPPSDEELADEMRLSAGEIRRRIDRAAPRTVLSLESLRTLNVEGNHAVSLLETLPDEDVEQPGSRIEELETKEELLAAIDGLPARERLVIRMYYFEGFTMGDIGRVFGVTESRVSQLHKRALQSLRADLNAERDAA